MKINQPNSISYNYAPAFSKQISASFPITKDSFEAQWKKERDDFVEKLKNFNLVNKKYLKKVAQADNKYQAKSEQEAVCRMIFYNYEQLLNSEENLSAVQKAYKFKRTTLDFEKQLKNTEEKLNKEMIDIFRTLSKQDSNPDVLQIRNKLLNLYGIKCVYLDDNIDCAKLVFDAMKLLKKKNFPLPDNIIVSRHFPAGGISMRANGESTILISSDYESDLWQSSTDNPLHTIIHEAVHCTQPNLIAFNIKQIPQKFQKTVSELSLYADGNFAHEIHAELVAKQLLDKLSPDEEELLKFFEKSVYKNSAVI